MYKYFIFTSRKVIQEEFFIDVIAMNYYEEYELKFLSEKQGYIFADTAFLKVIENLISLISVDLDMPICVLVSYAFNDITKKALTLCMEKTGVFHLSDLLIDLLNENNKALNRVIYQEFHRVNRDILLTAQAYLQNGQNALAAASRLYLHRNTFTYRLNKFIEETGLDIRDYHNSVFFLIAMRISNL